MLTLPSVSFFEDGKGEEKKVSAKKDAKKDAKKPTKKKAAKAKR